MVKTLITIDGIACRSCGAVRAPHHIYSRPDVCDNCWGKFLYARKSIESPGKIEDDFTKWLARKLILDLKRLEKNGVIGRCEAVSDWMYGRRGYQCAHNAVAIRGGHRVCGLHRNANAPDYESGGSGDPYVILEHLVRRLIAVDARFLGAISKAMNPETAGADFIGTRFGRLTVREKTDQRTARRTVIYRCECDCGRDVLTDASSLQTGNTQSCGCFRAERSRERAATQGRNEGGLWIQPSWNKNV
jgi:hypothetical protein